MHCIYGPRMMPNCSLMLSMPHELPFIKQWEFTNIASFLLRYFSTSYSSLEYIALTNWCIASMEQVFPFLYTGLQAGNHHWRFIARIIYPFKCTTHSFMDTHTCEPHQLLYDTFIKFYHLVLAHAGPLRVAQTMALQFWHPFICTQVEKLVQCWGCQESQIKALVMDTYLHNKHSLYTNHSYLHIMPKWIQQAILSSKDC